MPCPGTANSSFATSRTKVEESEEEKRRKAKKQRRRKEACGAAEARVGINGKDGVESELDDELSNGEPGR